MLGCPKLVAESAPHSPLAAGFDRLQSGVKFPFVSAQVRVALCTDVLTGLFRLAKPVASASRYRLTLALRAVLPVPNRSHDPPILGERSFQFGTSCTAPYWRAGTNVVAARLCAGTYAF